MSHRTNRVLRGRGFALILVLMLLSVSVVLGITYLASASVKTVSSANMVQLARARYLAESAAEHGKYILQSAPDKLLATSSSSPMGPYYADDTTDSYTVYAVSDPKNLGQYTIVGTGYAGPPGKQVVKSVSVEVARNGGKPLIANSCMLLNANVTIPASLTIRGDVSVNGKLTNSGTILGNATYSVKYTDGGGTISGTTTKDTHLTVPLVSQNDYKSYKLFGKQYACNTLNVNSLGASGPLVGGNTINAGNPAGVLWVKPPSGVLTLTAGFKFTGTLIVEGALQIDGADVQMAAAQGFPAMVVTDRIYITDRAVADISGLVQSTNGIVQSIWATPNAKITIHGAMASSVRGFDANLWGTHVVEFNEERAKLYDVKTGTDSTTNLQILNWND